MVDILIRDLEDNIDITEEQIEYWHSICKEIYQMLSIGDKDISIVLTSDDIVSQLNSQYRNKPQTTDVLSFPLSSLDSDEKVLGEIIISVAKALEQAEEYGHNLKREIAFLIVHGMLHLIGYDHDEDHSGEMRAKEKDLTNKLGLK